MVVRKDTACKTMYWAREQEEEEEAGAEGPQGEPWHQDDQTRMLKVLDLRLLAPSISVSVLSTDTLV